MKSLGWVLPQPDWEPYKKRSLGQTCTEARWSWRHRGTMPAAKQGERPQTYWSQASSLLSHKETHFCCVSCLVCGALLWCLLKAFTMGARTSWMLGLWTFYFLFLKCFSPRCSHGSSLASKAFLGCHLSSEACLASLSIIGAHALSLFSIPLKIFSFLSLF